MELFDEMRKFHAIADESAKPNGHFQMLNEAIAREKRAIQSQMIPAPYFWPFVSPSSPSLTISSISHQSSSSFVYQKDNHSHNSALEICEERGNGGGKFAESLGNNQMAPTTTNPTCQCYQVTPGGENTDEEEQEKGKEDEEELGRQRRRFLAIMGRLERNSERPRQLLSRQRYEEYLDQLKRTTPMRGPAAFQRNYRDARISARFELDPSGRVLIDKKSGKPYICYEDMFDCIHRHYRRPKYGGIQAVYAELKSTYANITLQCVTMYLRAYGHNLNEEGEAEIGQ